MQVSRRNFLYGSVALGVSWGNSVIAKTPAPKDAQIENIIAKMTLEEKAGQLSIFSDGTRSDSIDINPAAQKQGQEDLKKQIRTGYMGSLFSARGAKGAREYQRVAIEESRTKIPLLFAADIIHGCDTQFPIPLGEAASWDLDLMERTAAMAAFEASASGIQWTFAPMVDVARDQRWGRVAEGAGEDPYLGSLIARARVKGFQGKSLKDETSVLACTKHFAAYGGVQGGMDYNTTDIPETTLRETHLPAFKAGVDAGVLSTMSSFNDIAGVPSTGNYHLLTEILRNEWGFKGLVVSDYTSDWEMINHGFAKDERDAVKKSIMAGLDISMQSHLYNRHLPDLVRKGEVPMKVVDEAVRRVLYVKKALGLFENPYRSLDPAREKTDLRTPKAIALSREAARKSAVLLKNDGLLPLKKSGQKIALIGPLANDKYQTLGTWAIFPDFENAVTLEKGLRNQISDNALINSVKGCEIEGKISGGIDAAIAAAKDADVVILALGESENMSGEAQSRVEIKIPAPQIALADAIAELKKPTLVVLTHGRALELPQSVQNANSIIAGWFLGSEHGNGLADLIFGDYSPSGRLPVSFPHFSGQQPYYYNRRNTGRPQGVNEDQFYKARYRETRTEALYPFGHGLTYSKFEYSSVSLSAKTLKKGGKIIASATIKNTGNRKATEVVQLYIRDRVASITRPIRELKGFERVTLDAGESRIVKFEITTPMLAFVQKNLKWGTEIGEFEVHIAANAQIENGSVFELV